MDGLWDRIVEHLASRITGPMHFRIFLQPAVALFFGIRDGLRDARDNKPAYFWAILTLPGHRAEFLLSGMKSVAKVVIAAIILDAIYQLIVLRWFYPGEALIVAMLLAFIPYLLIRGPVNRVVRWWVARRASHRPRYGTAR
jgi:hypothetical protein